MEQKLIIKFGDHQYMKELIDDGIVFMNTLELYRTLERDDERKDKNEGAVKIRNLSGGTLRIQDKNTGTYNDFATLTHSTIRELNSNIQYLNVYCLYYCKAAMPILSLGDLIADRVKAGLGQYAVIITDPESFVTRVKAAAEAKGYKHFRKLVEYTDLTEKKAEVGPFVKHLSYAHQKELRIAVHTDTGDNSPITLKIGSIRDIAALVPVCSLDEISITENGS